MQSATALHVLMGSQCPGSLNERSSKAKASCRCFFKVVQPNGDREIIDLALAVMGFCHLPSWSSTARPRTCRGMRVVLGRFSAFPISDLML
jgi:hypothetical protein